MGKEKICPELKEFCDKHGFVCPKPKTIGRLIKDLGGLRIYPQRISRFGKIKPIKRQKVLKKPKDFKAKYPGHCAALDTIEKIIDGKRKYIITFEDLFTRFGFAWETTSHASLAAKEFFTLCRKVFPFSFAFMFVLTDNGSEFKKHFSEELKKLHLIHYHTYPKTPKMNAHVERFNRTLQEEFIDYHMNDLLVPETFNRKLADYLIWYNTKRVHYAFQNKLSPIQFMLLLAINQLPEKCKIGWPHTVNWYDYVVLNEVKESLYFYNEKRIQEDILHYLWAVNYDPDGSRIECKYTEKEIEVTVEFFKLIAACLTGEEMLDDAALDYARDIQRKYARIIAQDSEKKITETELYQELFDSYVRHLKEKALHPFIGNESFRDAVKAFPAGEEFKAVDTRLREHITHMVQNLVNKFGYTEQGAKEICLYVIDRGLVEKFKD
ncbi:MAG: hypothetical protein COV00_01370 [Candidatus Tagabacteria bacterium CG10_big_fil_rev_8_21_14_0_10_40_13]|uniref:Integrase catalytic domain-containing protein n=1 Tax=Candidatus Tagabacteria bacterium CG10_big_fil_rev_8_21_14_0_10_40_13 TaxID=1975022 RepID=A0A2M8L974_9BACT|nr:MAG: hypothetical protein COV00_01370 [Candidatus Tagabacteria bacterium CG10_big_fil_rev_8_21_14_0_10_40_13]